MTASTVRVAGLVLAGALLGTYGAGWADTITKADGTVLVGQIESEDGRWVTIQVSKDGKSFTIPVPKRQIVSIQRGPSKPAPDKSEPEPAPTKKLGPGYYPLPLKGELGVEIQARFLAEAIEEVRKSGCDYLVLVIDSPGGSAREASEVAALVQNAGRDMRVVGLIHQAVSSAAMVAMVVPELYIRSTGRVGDATGEIPDAQGRIKPLDRGAKQLVRTRLPALAKAAGHPELLARGFVDPSMELAIGVFEGKKILTRGRGGKVLTVAGKPLVLTGSEAVDAGLARGLAEGLGSLNGPMGLKDWHAVGDTGWATVIRKGKEYRRERERTQRKDRREAYLAEVGPRLEEIDKELAEIKERDKEAERKKRALKREFDRELREIERDYDADKKDADQWAEDDPDRRSHQRRQAKARRDRARKNLYSRVKSDVERVKETIAKLKRAMDALQAEKKEILRKAPK